METRIKTGKVRFGFVNVFEPRGFNGSAAKYSAVLLIPKSDALGVKKVEEAIKAATEQGKAKKWSGKIPANFHSPLRDGDTDKPNDPLYAGHWFINAKASENKPPEVVDGSKFFEKITDPNAFYSGCYGKAVVNFYPYDVSGSRGVSAWLDAVVKLEDGPHLSGRKSAAEMFADDDDFLGL